nr:protein ROLLING AND ERECT LEAF 2 isoform X2 [Nicotiana tomentosiformis]
MGCTQSKIENEETVTRCKERKHFMKEAVSARNAFAAAHSAYTMSLKNTGAALSDYAHGEVQFPSTAAVAASSSSPLSGVTPPLSSTPLDMPPPPPLPPFSNPSFPPSPLQRAATMPEISIPVPEPKRSDMIIEEENEDDMETESTHSLRHRSSKSSGGGGGGGIGGLQTPPSPPRTPPQNNRAPPPPPPPDSKGVASMSWDFFFPSMDNVPGPTLAEVDESRIEREELERKMYDERAKRAENANETERVRKSEMPEEAEVVETAAETPSEPPPPPQVAAKVLKRVKNVVPGESKKKGGQFNLLQIFSELDDCFLKASESAHEVSKMLEANRLHYHSNFADNRGHIDHSARVMRVITWNRSFRGLPNADDGLDDFDSEEHETHATVLDKMLAWEKKLYDEVKAGEQMKLEYQKKVASLNKLKKRGTNTEALERVKATVSHLHTRYIVDMQSMDSTVSEINRLRDEQLYPKLVALVDGMAIMWETMRGYHKEEMKLKDRCEDTRRELNKKTRQYEDWYQRHMQRRTPPDEMDPDQAHVDSLVVDRQLQLEALRKKLEDEEEAYQRQCLQVRDKSLTSLRSRLPELFGAMSEFSLACADMYRDLRSISKHRNRNGNS